MVNMKIGLYDTFANPQGCHIIRGALSQIDHLVLVPSIFFI